MTRLQNVAKNEYFQSFQHFLLLLLPILALSMQPAVTVEISAGNRTSTDAAVQCVRQLDACRCETANGGMIDLSPLAKSGGEFAFGNRLGPDGTFYYFYNPCGGATCDGNTDAAACQKTTDGVTEFLLGTQSSAKFVTDPTIGLLLTYTGQSSDMQQREAQLQLVCDTSGGGVNLFTPLDDGVIGQPIVYKMSLLSEHCCESGSVVPGGGGGPSAGDILLIVFFAVAFLYLAVGLAVNLLILKRSRQEAVPNVAFWLALPALVRDGAQFTYGAAKGVVTSRRGKYDSV